MAQDPSLVNPAPEGEPELIGPSPGVSGTHFGYGLGDLSGEEYNPNLSPWQWRGYAGDPGIADRMVREDSVCAAVGLVITKPLESATWTIPDVSTDPKDEEIGDFLRYAFFEAPRQTWRGRLSQILSFALRGLYMEEPVYRLETSGPWKGKIVVDRFAPRLPRTIDEWVMDTEERLQGIRQVDYAGGRIPGMLRTNKAGFTGLCRYTFQQYGNNWEGRGLLRPLYRPYKIRQDAWRRWAIAMERWSTGIPVMEGVPPAYLDKHRDNITTILKNLKGHSKSYAYTPTGATIKLLGPNGQGVSIVKDAIDACAAEMAIGTLTMLLMLGRETGTYNLGEVQRGTLADAFQSIAKQVCEVNHHGTDGIPGVLQSLVRINFGPDVDVPPLSVSGIADLSPKEVFDTIASGGAAETGFKAQQGDNAYWRSAFNMEPPEETDEEEPPEVQDPEPPATETHSAELHTHSCTFAVVRPDPDQSFTTWRELTDGERFVNWTALQSTHDNLGQSAGAVVLDHERRMIDAYLPELMGAVESGDPDAVQEVEVPGVESLIDDLIGVGERAAAKGYAAVAEEYRRQQLGLPAFPEQSDEAMAAIGRRLVLLQGDDDESPFPGAEPTGVSGADASYADIPQELEGTSLADIIAGYSKQVATWVADRIRSQGVAVALSQVQSGSPDEAAIRQALEDMSSPSALATAGIVSTASISTGRAVAGDIAKGLELFKGAAYSAVLDANTCQPCRETDRRFNEEAGGLDIAKGEDKTWRPPNSLCKGRGKCRCAIFYTYKTEV